ncbi:four helix bundle protein [Fulvivirgaceae bacterium BMA10]|uniref:Four helix bundle protein n=1 Tax=Splendidivirga corallicola TaxID=3051826 RepID=A0ABT8KSL1_9BACT|nr:four helix bundle protein [Fulvivirgaceae bacterium BMA10]
MKKENIVKNKSYAFALRIIKTYELLLKEKKEFVLSKQLLRSGTSIGANIEEAIGSQSERDFLYKITIAYKEARETHYWLRLLRDSHFLAPDLSEDLLMNNEELLRIIGSIQKTIKSRNS